MTFFNRVLTYINKRFKVRTNEYLMYSKLILLVKDLYLTQF